MDLGEFLVYQMVFPFLIFIRMMTMVVAVPFFGYKNVPPQVLLIIGAALSVALSARFWGQTPPDGPFVLYALGEILVGGLIGFIFSFIVYSTRIGGELVGQEMGFNMASTVDPETGAKVPLIAYLYELVAILIWFSIGGHHIMIRAVEYSIDILPPGGDYSRVLAHPELLIRLVSMLIEAAIRLAAPVFGILLLSTVGLGLLSKTVPQFNILDIGFPTRILVGLTSCGLLMPATMKGLQYVLALTQEGLRDIMEAW